jgi:hypothetical protein
MNKICKTNPIFKIPKMIITSAQITSYHSPVTIYHYAKQTQTKPILSTCMAGKIALSEVEGPMAINLTDVFYSHKAIKISVIAAERRF